jgi:hypothetical protein
MDPSCQRLWVHCTGCTQHFQRLILKGIWKMIFRNDVNALEHHNLLILAPKMVK